MVSFGRSSSQPSKELRVFPSVSLARLKVLFVVFGGILSCAVLTISYLMNKKLQSAARDREEMVALRVFDELEREISAFLDGENSRGPYAELSQTDPEVWAPFVVGYFKMEGKNIETVAADGATTENKRRITWAVNQLHQSRPPADASDTEPSEQTPPIFRPSNGTSDDELQSAKPRGSEGEQQSSTVPSPPPKKSTTPGSKIIDSLNRAPERRKLKSVPTPIPENKAEDQFSDYAERY